MNSKCTWCWPKVKHIYSLLWSSGFHDWQISWSILPFFCYLQHFSDNPLNKMDLYGIWMLPMMSFVPVNFWMSFLFYNFYITRLNLNIFFITENIFVLNNHCKKIFSTNRLLLIPRAIPKNPLFLKKGMLKKVQWN